MEIRAKENVYMESTYQNENPVYDHVESKSNEISKLYVTMIQYTAVPLDRIFFVLLDRISFH